MNFNFIKKSFVSLYFLEKSQRYKLIFKKKKLFVGESLQAFCLQLLFPFLSDCIFLRTGCILFHVSKRQTNK